MNWNAFGMQLFNNSVAIFGAETIGLSDYFVKDSDTDLMRYAKTAALWSTLDQAIQLAHYSTCDLIQGNYANIIDDVAYNTEVIALLDKSNVAQKINNQFDQVLPFSYDINNAIVSGTLKLGSKTLRDILDSYYPNVNMLNLFTHITRYAHSLNQ